MASCLDNLHQPLVLDTSVAINLAAAKARDTMLQALPNRVLITDVVLDELRDGERNGHEHFRVIEDLIATERIQIEHLDGRGEEIFRRLVLGATSDTVDDGEAATIAYGVSKRIITIVDDGKALQISRRLYPELRLAHSIDIFAHPAVEKELGAATLSEVLFDVLISARMRVLPHHLEWVSRQLGPERCSMCKSLPAELRRGE